MPTASEMLGSNAKIYYEIAIESSNLDPQTKAVAKGMGNVVIEIASFIAFSIEKDGKIETRDAVTFAISKINNQFSMIPVESVQCVTATVDLALAAEAAFDGYKTYKVVNLVPVAGNKAFVLMMIYHALMVLKAAMSFKEQCFVAQGSDQLSYIRATIYLERQNFV